ncbi:MAG TPA: flagellar basal body-associated FliL family protein [Dongiaceae bacterium]|nr:flagellar basal body-associated FliL family protein [Dongiaceae bacterium]
MSEKATTAAPLATGGGASNQPDQRAARKRPLGAIAAVLLVAIGAGGILVWLIGPRSHTDAATIHGAANASPAVVHLDGFTVNLADPEDNHFLRVTLDLEIDYMPVPTERSKPNSGLPMARIRDAILSELTVCKADDLLTPAGKQQLKKNLLDTLNRRNPDLGIHEIYFSEFLVQR